MCSWVEVKVFAAVATVSLLRIQLVLLFNAAVTPNTISASYTISTTTKRPILLDIHTTNSQILFILLPILLVQVLTQEFVANIAVVSPAYNANNWLVPTIAATLPS